MLCHEFCVKNPDRVVTCFDFCQLFSKSWHKAMTMSNVISSFKVTGICPFDQTVIEVPDTKENEYSCFKPESVVQRYGLAYIPLYSPGHSLKAPKSRVMQQTPLKLEHCFNKKSRSTLEDSLLSPEAYMSRFANNVLLGGGVRVRVWIREQRSKEDQTHY